MQVILEDGQISTDLYVKPTDTHQYLEASSCHVFHSKRSIPYSQALRLNRICSKGSFFDKRCDELESWLQKRGYSQKLVRQQVLRARKFKRDELLDKQPAERKSVLTLNITYHPAYAKVKNILSEIHLLLTPNEEHRKVFPNIPLVGFKRGKSLQDFLVRAKLPPLKPTESGSKPCKGSRCEVCKYISCTNTFSNKEGTKTYEIKGGNLHCSSQLVVYLVDCKTCKKQYVGSTKPKFRLRFNN